MTIPLQSPFRTEDPRTLAQQLSQHERATRDELSRVGDGRMRLVTGRVGEYAASVGDLIVVTSEGPSDLVLPPATRANVGQTIVVVRESGSFNVRAQGGSEVEGAASVSGATASVRLTSAAEAGWWNV